MVVTVNGEERTLPGPTTLAEFLAAHGLERRMVVVEHNRVILERTGYADVELRDGDTLEIVQMMAGG